jgi:SAM-dependent methyltransferase
MLLLLQNVLYCLLYALLIKCAVKNDGHNCLYFYPKDFLEEAQIRGIADKKIVMKRAKWFMIPFCIIIFVALILIISVWNHVTDLKTAYLQSCLFIVVSMNGFHAFPNKKKAFQETWRVLKPGGTFIACFYIKANG